MTRRVELGFRLTLVKLEQFLDERLDMYISSLHVHEVFEDRDGLPTGLLLDRLEDLSEVLNALFNIGWDFVV